jgi:hypothetical protein
VFSDLARAIADGARVISDFRVMGDQRELFGPVASVPTAWRALKEIAGAGDRRRRKVTAAVNKARRHAWELAAPERAAITVVPETAWEIAVLSRAGPRRCASDAAHRVHARVEDVIRTGENTGLGHFRPASSVPGVVGAVMCVGTDGQIRAEPGDGHITALADQA